MDVCLQRISNWKPFKLIPSLKLTASLPLKMDGWKMDPFLLDFGLFSGAFAVSFRERGSQGFLWPST